MSDLFSKLSKAADAFAEIMTEDVKPEQDVKMYTYEDFRNIVINKRKKYPQITKCTISVQLRKSFDDMVFSENKYIIRILMLDEEQNPICIKGSRDEYVGALVIADIIDKRLSDFMGEKTEKTVNIGGK